jgi:hypothetical protein
MANYKILYWYDIPTQVRAEDENGRAGVQLHERFQLAIDEAAMAAKIVGQDGYTDGFQWGEEMQKEGSAKEVAQEVAAQIEAQYPEIDWRATAAKLSGKKTD